MVTKSHMFAYWEELDRTGFKSRWGEFIGSVGDVSDHA